MSLITIGLDENKKYARCENSKYRIIIQIIYNSCEKYFRATPPGGHTSNVFNYQYDGQQQQQQQPGLSRRQEGGGARPQPGASSRFSAALEQPALSLATTTAEKIRTPK